MCTATPDVRKIARERERAVNRYVVMTFFGNVERVWVNLRNFWICPRIFRKFVKFLDNVRKFWEQLRNTGYVSEI